MQLVPSAGGIYLAKRDRGESAATSLFRNGYSFTVTLDRIVAITSGATDVLLWLLFLPAGGRDQPQRLQKETSEFIDFARSTRLGGSIPTSHRLPPPHS